MNHPLRLGSLVLAAAIGLSPVIEAATAHKTTPKAGSSTTYKWVDEQGITHYGDAIPPDASGTSAQVLNRNAVAIRELPAAQRATTDAAPPATPADEGGLEAQRRADRRLMSTYTSVRDIERLRDERLSQINSHVTATRGYIDTVTQRLETLRQRSLRFKPYSNSVEARRMPDTLTAELVQALNEERLQREILAAREQEATSTRDSFQSDIDRYQKLVGR